MATLFPDTRRLFGGIIGKAYKYTPQQIMEEFQAYIEDLKNNPITVDTVYVAQNLNGDAEGNGGRRPRRLQNSPRPPRIEDFVTRWLGMSRSWWYELPKGTKGATYKEVTERISEYCYNVKFAGATIGIYNANIIGRELGLQEHVMMENKGEQKELSVKEAAEFIKKLEAEE